MASAPITAAEFLEAHGRLPRVDDAGEFKPWNYRGWLLYYLHAVDEFTHRRWTWWFDQLEDGGAALREGRAKIPQMNFGSSHHHSAGRQHIEDLCALAAKDVGYGSSLSYLVSFMLWGFGLKEYDKNCRHEKANEALYRKLDLSILMKGPSDHLGTLKAQGTGSGKFNNPNAFFPTPHEVVECMVRMMMHDHDGDPFATVLDPCLGTGRMLMSASNASVALFGCDIDRAVLDIALVNGFLYVPWLVCPMPGTGPKRDAAALPEQADPELPIEPENVVTEAPLAAIEATAAPATDGFKFVFDKKGQGMLF